MRSRLSVLSICLALTAPYAWAQDVVPLAPDTSWVRRSALYEIFVRDFAPGGNLRGVIDGLGRVDSAGANVLWLMPIHPVGIAGRKGTLGSPYAARDYDAIDSAFGTAADFLSLVGAAHFRGMKVILDWVPDHTAPDHPWVRQHPDWYVRNERGEPSVPRDAEGHLTDWTDVVQLDFRNPELRAAMIATMRRWLVDYGIDGFRVDVAGFVPDDFWREAIPQLRAAVNRPILLLAEWGDLKMHRLGFDLSYSWDAYSRLKAVWRGDSAVTFVRRELAEAPAMPPGGMRMRFTTNHDETAWDNPPVAIFGGSAGARAAFVAATLLPGRPLLYNGQEVESPQKLRLFEHDDIAWDQPQAAQARAFYRRVIQLARTDAAIVSGELQGVTTSAPADVIAYRRGDVLVLVNTRSHETRLTVTGFNVDRARDLLSDRAQRGRTVTLPAYGITVLARRPRG